MQKKMLPALHNCKRKKFSALPAFKTYVALHKW